MINGNLLIGHPVSPFKFQAVGTLNQLQAYGLNRPSSVETAKSTDASDLQQAKAMHDQMQRRFDAPRIHRSVDYRDYIYGVEVNHQMGGTPAITIWFPTPLESHNEGIIIPYNATLTAIDGETQTEARYMLRDGVKVGKVGRVKMKKSEERDACPETGDNFFAITLYHGVTIEHAQQILRDYNAEAHPIDARKAAIFDHNGPLANAVQQTFDLAKIPPEKINRSGNVAGKRYKIAYKQVLDGLAGYALNGVNPSPVTAVSIKLMNRPLSNIKVSDQGIRSISQVIAEGVLAQAPSLVWQAVGHKLSSGATNLNYQAAIDAYDRTKVKGRGGPRMAPRLRLNEILKAL